MKPAKSVARAWRIPAAVVAPHVETKLVVAVLCLLNLCAVVPLFAQSALESSVLAPSPQKLSRYEAFALTHEGDPELGKKLFLDEKTTKCIVCHQVDGRGGVVGPDLSHIGGKFDRPHLIESLLEPSRQIVENYRATVLVLQDGRVQTGVIKQQSDVSLTLVDADGKQQVIDLADVDERQESFVSLMPQGLADLLTPDQFTDLIAYLEKLRSTGKRSPGASIAGAIRVPQGFRIETVSTGLSGATALETLVDGRILVCEQAGAPA